MAEPELVTVLRNDAKWGADALQYMLDEGLFSSTHVFFVAATVERLRAVLEEGEAE